MFARIMVGVVVVVAGCQGPESFHARLEHSAGPGSAGSSGAAGTGILPIMVPGGAGGSYTGGAGGGGIVTGQAGVGATGGVTGQAGAVGGFGGTGGTGGTGVGATGQGGTGGGAVNAGAGRGGGRDAGTGGGARDAGVETPPPTPYIPAQWRPTASITAAGNADVPANVLDGDLATRWTTGRNQTGNEWFLLDLGKTESISRVVLDDTRYPLDFPVGYTLEVSTNGNTFTMVGMGKGAAVTRIDFTSTMARSIRIKQTGATPAAGSWWSIGEIQVYP
jgi:hypothetical protein